MKKIISAILLAAVMAACSTYDDTDLRGKVENLESRVDALDVMIQKTNANLNAMQAIVEALDENEYITGVDELTDQSGNVIGYTITFAHAGSKTIYNGKDASSPSISAASHPELGVYCWQIDGEWLTADGKPVPVAGATPQLKVENGVWMISYDGKTWEKISVTGEDITVVCQFESVTVDKDNNSVTFVTNSGESFTLPLGAKFAIVLPAEPVRVDEGMSAEVPYTIEGADEDTDIYVIATDGAWKVTLVKTDHKSGVIKVTAPAEVEKGTVLLGAANHKGQSDICALSLSSEVLRYENLEDKVLLSLGDEITVDVVTNIDYEVNIDVDWLKHLSTIPTKALRNETLTFAAEKNPTDMIRVAKVSLLDKEGNVIQTFSISQEKNGGDFTLNWAYSDAALTQSFAYSEPAIDADGNVYVISKKNIVKINSSGTKEWSKNLDMWGGNCPDVTPSLEADGSVVYVAGGIDNKVGVYALNTSDGSEKWTTGYDRFFKQNTSKTLTFWRAGVAVGDEHLFVSCTRGYSVNAFSKADGSRTSYMSTSADGSRMHYSLTNSPVLTADGVVAAKSGQGMVGASRALMEYPSEDFKTENQDYYAPCGIYTTFKTWSFNDRAPIIAVGYEGGNYVVSGGTESKEHHFHVWYQNSSRGLETTIPTLPSGGSNIDYNYTIAGMKQTANTGGGGLVAGARNEVIVSAEPADKTFPAYETFPYTSGGFVAAWPAKKSMAEAFAYRFEHDDIVPGSCAVDNNGYVHAVDINGKYFILKPDYDAKTVTVVRKISLKDLVEGCGVAGVSDADSVNVKSSVKLGSDGKIYINGNFVKGETSVGATLCFSYKETTGICGTSTWPQSGADPMNTNRQVGYKAIVK